MVPQTLYELGPESAWKSAAQRAVNEHILEDQQWTKIHKLDNGFEVIDCRVRASDKSMWYFVRLLGIPKGLLAGCTCTAGEHGNRCKHVARILMVRGLIETPKFESKMSEDDRAAGMHLIMTGKVLEKS